MTDSLDVVATIRALEAALADARSGQYVAVEIMLWMPGYPPQCKHSAYGNVIAWPLAEMQTYGGVH